MWILQILGLVWNNLFTISIPVLGGITFGTILIISFIGLILADIVNKFMHRGE